MMWRSDPSLPPAPVYAITPGATNRRTPGWHAPARGPGGGRPGWGRMMGPGAPARPRPTMVQLNADAREIAVKVVYYGPALSGKTTNLQALFQKIDPKVRGRLMTLDTKDDRTLFFDMMPVFFRTEAGVKVKLESTRRIVLQGSDAVVFVADSRRSEAAATLAYWNDMLKNLEANGLDYRTLPIVIQMNKRDLDDARGDGELGDLRAIIQPQVVPAVAIRGEGVVETLHALLQRCYRSLDRSLGLEAKWRVSEGEFLDKIFSPVDMRGTRLAPPPGAPPG